MEDVDLSCSEAVTVAEPAAEACNKRKATAAALNRYVTTVVWSHRSQNPIFYPRKTENNRLETQKSKAAITEVGNMLKKVMRHDPHQSSMIMSESWLKYLQLNTLISSAN